MHLIREVDWLDNGAANFLLCVYEFKQVKQDILINVESVTDHWLPLYIKLIGKF